MEEKLKKLVEKIGKLKTKDINEAATKDYLIRPFFEYLDWDFSNPDDVAPEESDSSGKRPDYSLYINGKSKILVEAKALNNQLNDVKMISEKMHYCSTKTPFLIITNGFLYKIYYSELKGDSKDKLLFDFQLDEDVDEDIVNKLRKNVVANDELLKFAQHTYVSTNVKKALELLFQDPPKDYLNIIRGKIKDSLGHAFDDSSLKEALQHFNIQINIDTIQDQADLSVNDNKTELKNWTIEYQFKDGKWGASFELYKKLINHLKNGNIEFDQNPTKYYIGLLSKNKKNFCQIRGQKKGLKIWIHLEVNDLTEQEKLLVRDVSNIGHWGTGQIEAMINSIEDINWCINIIKKAYQ